MSARWRSQRSSAPTGRSTTAQGNAWVNDSQSIPSPEGAIQSGEIGRNLDLESQWMGRPYRAEFVYGWLTQALPWAIELCPFGAMRTVPGNCTTQWFSGIRACLKIRRGPVPEETAGGRGATSEHTAEVCERGATKSAGRFRGNPPGGGSFGRGRRWLGPHRPLRVCSALAALATTKIPSRRTPSNFQTGS